jgi:hypothetical protein
MRTHLFPIDILIVIKKATIVTHEQSEIRIYGRMSKMKLQVRCLHCTMDVGQWRKQWQKQQ